MASNNPNQPTNFPDFINNIRAQIEALGPGPHSDADREKLKTLQLILSKAEQENLKTPLPQSTTTVYQQSQQQQQHQQVQQMQQQIKQQAAAAVSIDQNDTSTPATHKILDKKRLQDLVKEIDPMAQLEDEVEEVLMQIADDFIENVVTASCEIAKHRHSETLEVKDVQLYLDKAWNMWVPGFGSEELRPYRKAPATEAHKQRMALIKKTLKKS